MTIVSTISIVSRTRRKKKNSAAAEFCYEGAEEAGMRFDKANVYRAHVRWGSDTLLPILDSSNVEAVRFRKAYLRQS